MANDSVQNSNLEGLLCQGLRAHFSGADDEVTYSAFSQVQKLLPAQIQLHSPWDVYLYLGQILLRFSREDAGFHPFDFLSALKKDCEERENEETKKYLENAMKNIETASCIFTSRINDLNEKLAETYIAKGEIFLNSGDFLSAIESTKRGIDIHKTFGSNVIIITEAYLKLGAAYCANAQIDEAVEASYISFSYLNNEVNDLRKEGIRTFMGAFEEVTYKIDDLKGLIDEIVKKIHHYKLDAAYYKTIIVDLKNAIDKIVEVIATSTNSASTESPCSLKEINNDEE